MARIPSGWGKISGLGTGKKSGVTGGTKGRMTNTGRGQVRTGSRPSAGPSRGPGTPDRRRGPAPKGRGGPPRTGRPARPPLFGGRDRAPQAPPTPPSIQARGRQSAASRNTRFAGFDPRASVGPLRAGQTASLKGRYVNEAPPVGPGNPPLRLPGVNAPTYQTPAPWDPGSLFERGMAGALRSTGGLQSPLVGLAQAGRNVAVGRMARRTGAPVLESPAGYDRLGRYAGTAYMRDVIHASGPVPEQLRLDATTYVVQQARAGALTLDDPVLQNAGLDDPGEIYYTVARTLADQDVDVDTAGQFLAETFAPGQQFVDDRMNLALRLAYDDTYGRGVESYSRPYGWEDEPDWQL